MNTENEIETTETVEEHDERVLALAQFLNCNPEDLSVSHYDDTLIEYGDQEYYVLTDDEADDRWNESLDSYIDDCLEIPKWIEPYFDREKWKRDARFDGRGHSLSSYDGEENEEQVNGTWYYIYRKN